GVLRGVVFAQRRPGADAADDVRARTLPLDAALVGRHGGQRHETAHQSAEAAHRGIDRDGSACRRIDDLLVYRCLHVLADLAETGLQLRARGLPAAHLATLL